MFRSTYDIGVNGIVDNSEKLNNQSAPYYLSRANQTGTQLAATISDLSSAVAATSSVTANTAKVGITTTQASNIVTNNSKVGITTTQASNIVDNNAKVSNITHSGHVTGSTTLTIANDVVTSAMIVAGSIVNSDINTNADISATKIGTGVVNNTEFNYLDGVSSGIQAQLNSKVSVTSSTFTPTLRDGAGTTYSTSVVSGRYTSIGDLVFVEVNIQGANFTGSPSGSLEIRGLPFSGTGVGGIDLTYLDPSLISGTFTSYIATVSGTTAYIQGYYNNASVGVGTMGLPAIDSNGNGQISISGFYFK